MESERWQAEKAELLARLGEPGFWEDADRFAVLSGIELRDRMEALRSAIVSGAVTVPESYAGTEWAPPA